MKKYLLPILLILLGFSARLFPHPANFAPIGAIALFAGIYLPKRLAVILPLIAMFVSDILIGFYSWQIMLAVYTSFVVIGLIGLAIRKNKKLSTVLGGTILGSITFFIITNAAVWMFGTMYTPNFSGLIQSYTMAIPFFKNSLLGDLFYVGVMVGGFEFVTLLLNRRILATTKI